MRLIQPAPAFCLLLVFVCYQQISVIPDQAAADDGVSGSRGGLAVSSKSFNGEPQASARQ